MRIYSDSPMQNSVYGTKEFGLHDVHTFPYNIADTKRNEFSMNPNSLEYLLNLHIQGSKITFPTLLLSNSSYSSGACEKPAILSTKLAFSPTPPNTSCRFTVVQRKTMDDEKESISCCSEVMCAAHALLTQKIEGKRKHGPGGTPAKVK